MEICMSEAGFSIARHIATRYVSVGKHSQLVSFMSAVSVFGLALGITILITVLSVMNGFDREMRESILGIVPHLTVTTAENVSLADWEQVQARIEQDARVVATAPLIEVGGVLASSQGNKSVLINGVDASREEEISTISNFVQEGSVAALQQQQWGIVLGATLAERLAVGVGDKVDLFSANISINPLAPQAIFRSFQVVGVFRVGTQELDSELVVINIAAARALYKLRVPYTAMRIRLQDVLLADQLRFELIGVLPEEFVIASWTSVFGNIYENIKLSRTLIGLMLWLLIAVAAFNLVVSLIMIVRDKRGDIAILRTLGASPQTISRIFMWQGCMVGVIGTVIGVILGVLASWQISNFAEFLQQAFSIQLLSAEVYPIDYLPSQIRLADVILVALGVLLLSLLATIYPARRAAATQPAEALHNE
jgi:lipoprotein-releasing system permease protein